MMEAQMWAHAREIAGEFERETSRPHPLMGGECHALSIADEMDHLPECAGYPRSGMPANDADTVSRTVLVAEDEGLFRATVLDVLRSSGFDVREAATVGDAKSLLASIPAIDILFSDVRLPDGSGFELAEWCREVRPHVRILLTSGFYQRPTAGRELSALEKPYSFITLLAASLSSCRRRGVAVGFDRLT
jgi:CheY-like chemotaxis protein